MEDNLNFFLNGRQPYLQKKMNMLDNLIFSKWERTSIFLKLRQLMQPKTIKNSAHTDGGPCSQVCARETLRSAPIDMSGNFSVHRSAELPKVISPNP